MGKTDSGKAGEVGKCRASMSAQQTESGEMVAHTREMERELGTKGYHTKTSPNETPIW